MGFPIGYTRHCVVKAEQQGQEYEDTRVSMIGNSWHVGVVAWLLGQLTQKLGIARSMSANHLPQHPGNHSAAFLSMSNHRPRWMT